MIHTLGLVRTTMEEHKDPANRWRTWPDSCKTDEMQYLWLRKHLLVKQSDRYYLVSDNHIAEFSAAIALPGSDLSGYFLGPLAKYNSITEGVD